MHVRFIDNEGPDPDDPCGIINLELPRVPDPGEDIVLLGWWWDVISITTRYDTPTGQSERYDVRILKRVEVDGD